MSNAKIRVFVVAGGQSRRMPGVDKTRVRVAGEPLITRALSMGLSLSSRVEVVADRWDRFLDLGIYAHEDDGERGPVDAWRRVLKEIGPGEVVDSACRPRAFWRLGASSFGLFRKPVDQRYSSRRVTGLSRILRHPRRSRGRAE